MKANAKLNFSPNEFVFRQKQINRAELFLKKALMKYGLNCILLIDMAGNTVAVQDNGRCKHDYYSLAALASANFAAVDNMAKIVGEKEFSLLFHKGKKDCTHLNKVNDDLLLISLFSSELPLGLMRLRIMDIARKLNIIFKQS